MDTIQLISHYTPAVDVISLVFCALMHFVVQNVMFYSKDRKIVFLKRAINFIMIGAGSNIAFYLTVSRHSDAIIAIYLLRILYHVSFLFTLYVYLLYMKKMIDVRRRMETIFTYLTRILFICCIVLDILSPITKVGFCREDGKWCDDLVSPFNFFYVYTFMIFFSMLLFYSKRIIRFVRVCLGVTGGVVAGIMIYQGVKDINTYSSFTYVLPMLVVMILLHSKPFDDKTGALKFDSFDNYIHKKNRTNIAVDYIVLQMNTRMLDDLPDELGKVLNSFWHDSFKDAMSFTLTSDIYVLAIPKVRINGDINEKTQLLVQNELVNYYTQYEIPYKLLILSGLDFIENAGDILGIVTYLLASIEENSVLQIDDKKREELRVMKKVKETLANIEKDGDLDDPRVIVYCQPIRNMKTGKFDTAEALMRLSLDEVGIVPPYMFVTMAEEYGYIHTLTKIITNKVSKEIKRLEAEGYHFLRISVNVSATDIQIDGFCDEMIAIIRKNGVDPSRVGVELTESRTDSGFMILKQKMKILHDAGMTLYLDDIGTGYSNLDRIVQYDVDVVKFDRFFLLEAERSMKIIKMMSHLSQAFRDLDYKLLFEGVETEAHETLCMTCGAEYIQGFKYSRPIPIEELRNFFEKSGNEIASADDIVQNRIVDEPEKRDFTYEEVTNQYNILLTMANLFYSMHIIDLVHNTARPYNPTGDVRVVDVVNSSLGADEMMRRIMRMCTVEKYVDEVLGFSDLSTIAERMRGKKILESDRYIGKSIGWYVATFYTIEADEEGRPTKLLYTTRAVTERDVKQESKVLPNANTARNYDIREINEVLYANMDALLVVSSKDDLYHAIKRSEGVKRFIEEEGSYNALIETLLFHMNDSNVKIADDYQVFLPKMKEFTGKYARRINIEIDGIIHILQMLVCPVEEEEGVYIILLCDLDKSETEREVKLESKVIAMQETYLFSMYVDLNRDMVGNINITEISNDDMHYDVKYSEWRMMIVNMIWPEDQPEFLEKTDPAYLKAQLKPSKSISFDCQMKNLEGTYIWVKLIFGRTDTTNESDFRFVFMVQNIHNESIQLFDELKKYENLASHDALTGVYNHGRIETELSNALNEVKQKGRLISLMMLDIDYFKNINDTYGHAVGDETLKAFIQLLTERIAAFNVKTGRWGGEEFVCVCYDMDTDELLELAEEIRELVADTMFGTIGSMTCSIGISKLHQQDTTREAFDRLDKALYMAKARGRNCVIENQR